MSPAGQAHLLFPYVSLMWNRENNSGLRSHELTQKYPDCQLETGPVEPEQQRVLCRTFHRDLVLPGSWVGVQVDLDGHFSHGIIHTGACWEEMDTPPCTHGLLVIGTGLYGLRKKMWCFHSTPPRASFSVGTENVTVVQDNIRLTCPTHINTNTSSTPPKIASYWEQQWRF